MARPKDLSLEHTWRLRLRRQATSGLSIPEFCAREGVSSASFYAWRRRLAAPPIPAPSEPPLFVPLRLDPTSPPGGPAAGPRLRDRVAPPRPPPLRRPPDPEWLGRLVAALAGLRAPGGAPMISLPSAVRAFLCTRSVDMRKSFDGLSGLVEECFRQDLLDGHLFLFVNRRRDRIKILYFDRDGLAIWYKRLEVGSFQMPDAGDRDGIELEPAQLAMILSGIDLQDGPPAQAVPRRPA